MVTAVDCEPAGWTRLPEFFAELEAAGSDSIWLTDHLFAGHPSGEAFTLAAVAAAATRRCRIGTGVLQLALRRPAAVAKAATTLHLVSGGRFCLGVGAGQHRDEFDRAGVDFDGRGAAVDRSLAAIREFWQSGEGWFTQRPEAAVPIWIGGVRPPALRRLVEVGDGWLALFLSPERFAKTNARLDTLLTDAGRDSHSVERRIVLVACPTDATWTRRDALAWASRLFPTGSEGVERHVITGSVAECAARIRAFIQAGATGVDLQITHPEPLVPFADLRAALATGTD